MRFQAVVCSLIVAASVAAKEETAPAFDRGEKYDVEHKISYREKKDSGRKGKDTRVQKAVNTHLKNLKDADPETRKTSAEMLGYLGSAYAVEPLIQVLSPGNKTPDRVDRNGRVMPEHVGVLMAAHGSLMKLTGQNFGYKNYDDWHAWWMKEGKDFIKKAEMGVDEYSKIAAVTANTLGLELLRRGEYREAHQQFLQAVDRDPNVPDYHNNLGLALMEQGRHVDAMEYFDGAIQVNPDLPQPYMNIGRCYSRMNKSIEAQSWYKKAMERDKEGKIWDNFWMVGKEYQKRGEFKLAFEYLDQARAKAEKNRIYDPRLYNDLAITHYGMDEYHSAWKELMNVKRLGFEPNADFAAKVKKQLKDMGIDAEEEDRQALKTSRKAILGDEEEAPKKK